MTSAEYSLGEFGDERLAKGGLGCLRRWCVAGVCVCGSFLRAAGAGWFAQTDFWATHG